MSFGSTKDLVRGKAPDTPRIVKRKGLLQNTVFRPKLENCALGPVAELRKSAAGLFLPETAEKVEVFKKRVSVGPQCAQATGPRRPTCVYVENFSVFCEATRSFSLTHESVACPVPASSTAFSSQRPGPAGTARCGCWPCPRSESGEIQSRF